MIRIAAIFVAAGLGLTPSSYAQSPLQASHQSSLQPFETRSEFELLDGDRVLLLGSGFIEAAQAYGYVELALSTRWPDRDVTFRNIGWSGDTVFGEARLHYTNPPGPYERLLDEATAPRPTVLFVGYGADVPFQEGGAPGPDGGDGEAGEGRETGRVENGDAIGRFEDGLLRLLDDLETRTGARIILLSPPPHEADASPAPADFVRRINESLEHVSEVIERVARERRHAYVDVFAALDEIERSLQAPITSDGVQLNAAGYFHLARIIEEGLGLAPRGWALRVDVRAGEVDAEGARLSAVNVGEDGVTLELTPDLVSLPPPEILAEDAVPAFHARRVTAAGLSEGAFALTVEGEEIAAAADSISWSQGMSLARITTDRRAERLRRLIVEKNALYFHQYRPPNETYLVGFRSHEQGQNAEELGRFGSLIEEKEREIGRLKRPAPLMLKLGPIAGP